MACTGVPSGSVPSLLFCCLLLLVPHLASSYHAHGGKWHVVLRSPDGASPATFCSDDIPSGDDGGITAPLAVFHRLSPCSPRTGAPSDGNLSSVADVLRRDALGLRSLLSATVPTTGSPNVDFPGAYEYHVVVGYGTPLQRLAVGFNMVGMGLSLLVCKPCAAGASCGRTFDPSRSSTLAQIPCNSLDCPLSSCSGPTCMSSFKRNGTVWLNTTVVTDKLTLSGSATVDSFRFACMETASGAVSRTTIDGVLDLSPDSHSLASRAPLSADTVAFSYCLPSVVTSHGFLSIAAARPELSGRSVSYTALRTNTAHPNTYFVQLNGITVGGKNIPVPPAEFAAGGSMLALRTTFTYLKPDIYAVLREEFQGQMKRYRHRRVKPVGDLDTCYNFAGESVVVMPSIMFEFDGGAVLGLGIEQMMYLKEPHNAFSVACLAFAAWPDYARFGSEAPVAAIGTLAQTKTEVAYDLLGGKVGFAPSTC